MNHATKSLVVLILAAILTASAVLMIGPQIMVIVPVAIVAGVILAIRRSFLSLVCFGYPFTFGLVSALVGCVEIDGYERTAAFAVSVVIGMAGVSLITAGLWKALPGKNAGKTSGVADPSAAGAEPAAASHP